MKKPKYRIWTRPKDDAGNTTEAQDVTSFFEPFLIRLHVYDNTAGKADALKLELVDNGTLKIPSNGAVFDVEIGYEGGTVRKFTDFRVDQVYADGPPDRLQFSATGADFSQGARSPKERTHSGKPDDPLTMFKLMSRLAADNGVEAKVKPQSLADLELPLIDQAGQTDLGLAYEVAQTYGAVFKPTSGMWRVLGYGLVRGAEPSVTIRKGIDDLTSWNAHFVARRIQRGVIAYYQDNRAAKRIAVKVGSGEPVTKLHKTFSTAEIAEAHARARYYRAERRARQLKLEMPGRPDINTHSILRMQGFRDRVDADWLVTSVVHELDKKGYRTRVEGEGIGDLETV